MKLLFDESLSAKLIELLNDLFPDSESALRNGLAGAGDSRIIEYASTGYFILVSTDSDFEVNQPSAGGTGRDPAFLQLSDVHGCGCAPT